MENTLSNKAKFFAQYWGQKVMSWGSSEMLLQKVGPTYMTKHGISNRKLELKPLSSITDEEAESLGFENRAHFLFDGDVSYMLYDLRLLGFAVDWAGLSVEEQIEYGWVKLKSDN